VISRRAVPEGPGAPAQGEAERTSETASRQHRRPMKRLSLRDRRHRAPRDGSQREGHELRGADERRAKSRRWQRDRRLSTEGECVADRYAGGPRGQWELLDERTPEGTRAAVGSEAVDAPADAESHAKPGAEPGPWPRRVDRATAPPPLSASPRTPLPRPCKPDAPRSPTRSGSCSRCRSCGRRASRSSCEAPPTSSLDARTAASTARTGLEADLSTPRTPIPPLRAGAETRSSRWNAGA
jgi:hypothetical protein